MSINLLAERALLVTLNIRRWQAARTDKKITAEVASTHAVSEKRAGRYRKNAINVLILLNIRVPQLSDS